MKVGTLKKVVELAEGFRWHTLEVNTDIFKDYLTIPESFNVRHFYKSAFHGQINKPIKVYLSEVYKDGILYPLLLRRAVEGWNMLCRPYLIQILTDNVECFGGNGFRIINNYFDYQKTDYLTPQEQAIEACLIELLEE